MSIVYAVAFECNTCFRSRVGRELLYSWKTGLNRAKALTMYPEYLMLAIELRGVGAGNCDPSVFVLMGMRSYTRYRSSFGRSMNRNGFDESMAFKRNKRSRPELSMRGVVCYVD